MRVKLKVPKLGLTTTEVQVLEWTRRVGDPVVAGEVLCVLETDKTNVEVEAPVSGTLVEVVAPPGGPYAVGALLAVIAATEAAPA